MTAYDWFILLVAIPLGTLGILGVIALWVGIIIMIWNDMRGK